MLQLLDTVIGHVAVLSTRHIANSLWALATLKEKRPDLVDKLCGAAMAKVMDFNSQEISNSLWALATLTEQRPDMVDKLCGAAKAKVMNFNSQEFEISAILVRFACSVCGRALVAPNF